MLIFSALCFHEDFKRANTMQVTIQVKKNPLKPLLRTKSFDDVIAAWFTVFFYYLKVEFSSQFSQSTSNKKSINGAAVKSSKDGRT